MDKLQRLQQKNMSVEGYRQKIELYMMRVSDNVVIDAIKLILLNYSNVNIAKIVVKKIDRVK